MLKRWLLRIRGPFVYLVVVGLLIAGAYNATLLLRNNLESYQPLEIEVAPAQSLTTFDSTADTNNKATTSASLVANPGGTAPLTGRVVLVVVNGLGLEDVEALPALQDDNFKKISTGAYLFTGPVQQTSPALVTLLTGAGVELTGGFTLDPAHPSGYAPTIKKQLDQYDNLFSAVKRSSFTTALFGTNDWFEAIPPNTLDFYTTFDTHQPPGDVVDNALNFLKKKSANFTLIQLSALGQAQQEFGFNSPQALEARQSLNDALARLTGKEIDLPHTALIITGDWDNGVKAGDRWTAPLVMVGQAVQPGDKVWGRQEDVASTIAALLGVEIPRHNQGRFLSSLLSMPPSDQGEKFLALVEQRLALDSAYRTRLNLVLPLATNEPSAVEAEKNLKVARQKFRLGSYEDIEQVVDQILRYTRSDMEDARQEWFAQVRWQRAILSVVLLVLPLILLLIWRSVLNMLALGAALVVTALPYAIYWLQGRTFAFNSTGLPALQETSLWYGGISLLVGLLLLMVFFDWAEKRRFRRHGRVDLEYQQIADLRRPPFPFARLFGTCALMLAWLVYFSAFIWVVWYYWRFGYFGPLMGQPVLLPDHNASFTVFFAFDNLLAFALAMVPAPLVLIGLYWIKRRLRGDKLEEDEEQDILKKPRPGAESGIIKIS